MLGLLSMLSRYKAVFGATGAVLGSGGVIGLAHSTPTILWKTGVICTQVGDTVSADAKEDLNAGLYLGWAESGELSDLSKMDIKKDKNICYQR